MNIESFVTCLYQYFFSSLKMSSSSAAANKKKKTTTKKAQEEADAATAAAAAAIPKQLKIFELTGTFTPEEALYLRKAFHCTYIDDDTSAQLHRFSELSDHVQKKVLSFAITHNSDNTPVPRNDIGIQEITNQNANTGESVETKFSDLVRRLCTYKTLSKGTNGSYFIGKKPIISADSFYKKRQKLQVEGAPVYLPEERTGFVAEETYTINFNPVEESSGSWLLEYDLDFWNGSNTPLNPWPKLYAVLRGDGSRRTVIPDPTLNKTERVHDVYILSLPSDKPDVKFTRDSFKILVGKNGQNFTNRSLQSRMLLVGEVASQILSVLTMINLASFSVLFSPEQKDAYLGFIINQFNRLSDSPFNVGSVEFSGFEALSVNRNPEKNAAITFYNLMVSTYGTVIPQRSVDNSNELSIQLRVLYNNALRRIVEDQIDFIVGVFSKRTEPLQVVSLYKRLLEIANFNDEAALNNPEYAIELIRDATEKSNASQEQKAYNINILRGNISTYQSDPDTIEYKKIAFKLQQMNQLSTTENIELRYTSYKESIDYIVDMINGVYKLYKNKTIQPPVEDRKASNKKKKKEGQLQAPSETGLSINIDDFNQMETFIESVSQKLSHKTKFDKKDDTVLQNIQNQKLTELANKSAYEEFIREQVDIISSNEIQVGDIMEKLLSLGNESVKNTQFSNRLKSYNVEIDKQFDNLQSNIENIQTYSISDYTKYNKITRNVASSSSSIYEFKNSIISNLKNIKNNILVIFKALSDATEGDKSVGMLDSNYIFILDSLQSVVSKCKDVVESMDLENVEDNINFEKMGEVYDNMIKAMSTRKNILPTYPDYDQFELNNSNGGFFEVGEELFLFTEAKKSKKITDESDENYKRRRTATSEDEERSEEEKRKKLEDATRKRLAEQKKKSDEKIRYDTFKRKLKKSKEEREERWKKTRDRLDNSKRLLENGKASSERTKIRIQEDVALVASSELGKNISKAAESASKVEELEGNPKVAQSVKDSITSGIQQSSDEIRDSVSLVLVDEFRKTELLEKTVTERVKKELGTVKDEVSQLIGEFSNRLTLKDGENEKLQLQLKAMQRENEELRTGLNSIVMEDETVSIQCIDKNENETIKSIEDRYKPKIDELDKRIQGLISSSSTQSANDMNTAYDELEAIRKEKSRKIEESRRLAEQKRLEARERIRIVKERQSELKKETEEANKKAQAAGDYADELNKERERQQKEIEDEVRRTQDVTITVIDEIQRNRQRGENLENVISVVQNQTRAQQEEIAIRETKVQELIENFNKAITNKKGGRGAGGGGTLLQQQQQQQQQQQPGIYGGYSGDISLFQQVDGFIQYINQSVFAFLLSSNPSEQWKDEILDYIKRYIITIEQSQYKTAMKEKTAELKEFSKRVRKTMTDELKKRKKK